MCRSAARPQTDGVALLIVLCVLAWVVLPLPIAVLVGRVLGAADRDRSRPGPRNRSDLDLVA